MTGTPGPRCAGCGQGPATVHCSRCREAAYCSVKCSVADWPRHKQDCHWYDWPPEDGEESDEGWSDSSSEGSIEKHPFLVADSPGCDGDDRERWCPWCQMYFSADEWESHQMDESYGWVGGDSRKRGIWKQRAEWAAEEAEKAAYTDAEWAEEGEWTSRPSGEDPLPPGWRARDFPTFGRMYEQRDPERPGCYRQRGEKRPWVWGNPEPGAYIRPGSAASIGPQIWDTGLGFASGGARPGPMAHYHAAIIQRAVRKRNHRLQERSGVVVSPAERWRQFERLLDDAMLNPAQLVNDPDTLPCPPESFVSMAQVFAEITPSMARLFATLRSHYDAEWESWCSVANDDIAAREQSSIAGISTYAFERKVIGVNLAIMVDMFGVDSGRSDSDSGGESGFESGESDDEFDQFVVNCALCSTELRGLDTPVAFVWNSGSGPYRYKETKDPVWFCNGNEHLLDYACCGGCTDKLAAKLNAETTATAAVKNDATVGASGWPPKLRDYVERSFQQCTKESQRIIVEEALKQIIASANATNSLWTIDWGCRALPKLRVSTDSRGESNEFDTDSQRSEQSAASVKANSSAADDSEPTDGVSLPAEGSLEEMDRCAICQTSGTRGERGEGYYGSNFLGLRGGYCSACYDVERIPPLPQDPRVPRKGPGPTPSSAAAMGVSVQEFSEQRLAAASKFERLQGGEETLRACADLFVEAQHLSSRDKSTAAQVKAFALHFEAYMIDEMWQLLGTADLRFQDDSARAANAEAASQMPSSDPFIVKKCRCEMSKVAKRLGLGSDEDEDEDEDADEASRVQPGVTAEETDALYEETFGPDAVTSSDCPRADCQQMFEPGQQVALKNLQKASWLNGQNGEVICWHSAKERFEVRIAHGGGTKFVKPQNLQKIDASEGPKTRRHKSILIIEGMNIISAEDNFMTESILQACDKAKKNCITRVNFNYGESADAVSKCQHELLSGAYNSVIVSDLSCEFEAFQQHLGEHLQAFVRLGGVVSFVSSEGHQLQSTLQALFETTWTPGGYFRSTWGAAAENQPAVSDWFGTSATTSFSVKATTVRNVPVSDRCFGTTSTSRHESMSMQMMKGGAVPVGRGGPQDPCDDPDVPIDMEYDIVVAVHQYHDGAIAWFGDVNCEGETADLVLRFCDRRAPKEPVGMSSFSSLSESEFESVMTLKATGNASFKRNNFAEAMGSYSAALAIYGSRAGSLPAQRKERVNLSSNTAECLIRQGLFSDAVVAASEALSHDAENTKARIRRVKALAALDGDDHLEGAWADLKILRSNVDGSGDLIAKLTKQVRVKRQAAKSRAAGGLRAAFASGTSGLSSSEESRPKASWARGLTPPDLYEWFSNCYQMRCDDNYVYQGELGGPYDPEADGESIAEDFLVFCLLAARNRVVPNDWNWQAFLKAAPRWIVFAFEKSDAQERWGSENFFQAQMGGRSLRHTAMEVYGQGPDAFGGATEAEIRARADAEVWAHERATVAVAEVGGSAAWEKLLAALRATKGTRFRCDSDSDEDL